MTITYDEMMRTYLQVDRRTIGPDGEPVPVDAMSLWWSDTKSGPRPSVPWTTVRRRDGYATDQMRTAPSVHQITWACASCGEDREVWMRAHDVAESYEPGPEFDLCLGCSADQA